MSSSRLVSIVIPAYKPTFFEAALKSALRQNHDEIEILVCDDCPDNAIKQIVDRLSPESRWPIRYLRNATALGEVNNIAFGVQQARGEYIKFLYDDDILLPDCTRLLFDTLHNHPDIKLASATRKRIDEDGELMPDNLYTLNPFGKNVVLNGPDLVSFLAQNPVNFIGEPSSIMCRRADVLEFGQDLMSLKQIVIVGLGDVALYLKLLRHGNLALLARPLSYFRVSNLQTSEMLRSNPSMSRDGHANHYRLTRELGWIRPDGLNNKVRIAPLARRQEIQELDLLAHFDRRPEAIRRNNQVAAWLSKRKPTPAEQLLLREYLQEHSGGPAIAIVVSDFNQNAESVLTTLQSLSSEAPILENVKVFIVADYDKDAQTPLQSQLPWLPATFQTRASVINSLMQDNPHQWWILADAGTTFTTSGLLNAVMNIIDAPQASAVFCDEVTLNGNGGASLVFHPDFSLDYLVAHPQAMGRHWLFNRDAVLATGGFDSQFADAIELDLILRLIEHPDFSGFLHSSEPLVIAPAQEPRDSPDQVQTLQRHLKARGFPNSSIQSSEPGVYRINYGHDDQPLVSIIIISDNDVAMLLPCVESLLEKSTYQNYEILIADNNSQNEETVHWLKSVDAMQSEKIRILWHDQTLRHSPLLNAAAQQARGDYLLILGSDTLIIQEDWLQNLLNHAQRPEVGITGAKVLGTDGSVKSGAIILGIQGTAAAVSSKEAASSTSFNKRLDVDQNYSAVSGNCLMIRRSLFDDVKGFDEHLFQDHFYDIDLCLKVRDSGHLIAWTPHCVVVGRDSEVITDSQAHEFAALGLQHRWLHYLAWDPAYNRNLALQGTPFAPQADRELSWRGLLHRPLPVVLINPADRGDAGRRIAAPLTSLREQGRVDGIISHTRLILPELARLSADSVVIQGSASQADAHLMSTVKAHTNARIVYDLTELPDLVEGADNKPSSPTEIQVLMHQHLANADRVTVPTAGMAELLTGLHQHVQVIETRLCPLTWLHLRHERVLKKKPRVGWVGTSRQTSELEILTDVIKALGDDVEWIIMGPCSRWIEPYIHEVHATPEESLYPGLLAELDLDLVLVPAHPTLANQVKDPVSLLQFGACGYPVICSDTLYHHNLGVTLVSNQTGAWIEAIRSHLDQPEASAHFGEKLRNEVLQNWMLDNDASLEWRDVWSQ